MLGAQLTETEAAERAAEELKQERQLSPIAKLERRVGTDIEKSEQKYLAAFQMIDDAASAYMETLDMDTTSMVQTIRRASAIDTIKKALTDEVVKNIIGPLVDNPIGFMTDRKNEQTGYPIETLRDCVCQAMLHRARIDGNEFNIIKGSPMLVQNYWKRMVKELPDLSDLQVEFGGVEFKGNEAFVECLARWKVDGPPQEISRRANVKHAGTEWDRRIAVPMNRAMGRDAVIGKAERRLYKEIYERATGRRIQGMDEDDVVNVESKPVEPTVEAEPTTETEVESPTLFSEDPQEVADQQARLQEEYINLLGGKEDTKGVEKLIETATSDKCLLPETLEAIKKAGRQRFAQLKKKK